LGWLAERIPPVGPFQPKYYMGQTATSSSDLTGPVGPHSSWAEYAKPPPSSSSPFWRWSPRLGRPRRRWRCLLHSPRLGVQVRLRYPPCLLSYPSRGGVRGYWSGGKSSSGREVSSLTQALHGPHSHAFSSYPFLSFRWLVCICGLVGSWPSSLIFGWYEA